jgi:hypothetical protein
MAIKYNVRANVVDITIDQPQKSDTFLVDSNVWLWFAYTKASMNSLAYQTLNYPNYLKQCLSTSSTLIKTGLSLSELAHIIEKMEFTIFSKTTTLGNIDKKEYRHNLPSERANVVAEIEAVWNQIDPIGVQMEIQVEEQLTRAALARLKNECLDGYDAITTEVFLKTSYKNILTDDGDFATVNNITVFTANRNVIEQAKKQGKLITR